LRVLRTIGLCALIAGIGLAGCATPDRFEWGNYDSALYAYSKHPDHLPGFEQALQGAITKGRASGRLAPGLQAELGYLYLGEGRRADAIAQFRAEMADFPESRPLLTKIIAENAG
jgi:hypothetical protein